jgi:hypothetical protein
VLQVAGEDLVFHVDFLSERNPENALDFVGGTGRMKSIYTKAMKVVFRYEGYRSYKDFPKVRFPSPETFVVTKAAAAEVRKRKRDAFDIFVTVQDQDSNTFRENWRALAARDGLFSDASEALRKSVQYGDAVEKIKSVLDDMQNEKLLTVAMPNEEEIRCAFSFLNS